MEQLSAFVFQHLLMVDQMTKGLLHHKYVVDPMDKGQLEDDDLDIITCTAKLRINYNCTSVLNSRNIDSS